MRVYDKYKNSENNQFSDAETKKNEVQNEDNKKVYINSKFIEEIMEEINFVRTNPAEYAAKLELISTKIVGRKVLIGNSVMKLKEGQKLFEEAISYLLNLKKMDPIELIDELSESAYEYLTLLSLQEGIDLSEFDNSVRYSLEKRLDHYGMYFGDSYELIDYGSFDAEFVVANFILGDNDPTRNDRKIILNPLIKYCGAASGLLPSQKKCTVFNCVQYFFRPGEKIPNYIIKNYTYNNLGEINDNKFEIFFDKKKLFHQKYLESSFSYIQESPDVLLQNNKKVKKMKKITRRFRDKETGKKITTVKTIITYIDGQEVVDNYTL